MNDPCTHKRVNWRNACHSNAKRHFDQMFLNHTLASLHITASRLGVGRSFPSRLKQPCTTYGSSMLFMGSFRGFSLCNSRLLWPMARYIYVYCIHILYIFSESTTAETDGKCNFNFHTLPKAAWFVNASVRVIFSALKKYESHCCIKIVFFLKCSRLRLWDSLGWNQSLLAVSVHWPKIFFFSHGYYPYCCYCSYSGCFCSCFCCCFRPRTN